MTMTSQTDLGDDVPWASLKWSVTLRDADGDVDLSMGQALQVFAAVELDRVVGLDDVRRAIGRPGLWPALMDGARGLRPQDAPGDMTIREVLSRLGMTGVAWHFSRGKRQSDASLRETLAQLRGAA